ncbi:hypothetical protein K502DRAFT_322471 [Neoconidiobolus thromboides FSU 785]|nr:hypothetical protein K502DRAFT_322471 [Neoconidiobolus thromboides FSU 785]
MDLRPDADIFIGYASDSKKKFNYNHILLSNKNNGVIVNNINHKNSYGPTLKRGDIVGCYYDMIDDKVIFICNGIELCSFDYSFDGLPLSKTISCTPGTLIKYNFGNKSFDYRKMKLDKRVIPHEKTEEILPSYVDAKINYNL